MKIAVTGASGLIGSALVPSLRQEGHEVLRLVRRAAAAPDEVTWDPRVGSVDLDLLAGVDGFVHLAGAGIGDKRWSDAYKAEILQSRQQGTRTIAHIAAVLDPKPTVLVSASAIGYYGNTGDRAVDESGAPGEGFAAHVAQVWEESADEARSAGVRVVHPRSGLVMARRGGAWGRLLPLVRLGLGGRLGSGDQYWSFVTLEDEVRALTFMLNTDMSGPVNVTAPTPVTNAEVIHEMGRQLHRPTVFAVPSFALKVALGEFSAEVLGSLRVLPKALEAAGFTFNQPTIEQAVATLA
jgi:uncharacterized protein